MYEVMVKLTFSAAHRVEDYPGNCERLHGHNWVVEVFARTEQLDGLGMVVDFRKLKDAGVVTDRRDGRWVYYALVPGALEEMRAFLGEVKPVVAFAPAASCGDACCD